MRQRRNFQQSIVVSILDLNTTDTRHINTPAFVLGNSNLKLSANPKSASEIWNQQWHGIGIYSDIPVEGGILELEKQHKTHWRKGCSGLERKIIPVC
jgi:hypothetical protein